MPVVPSFVPMTTYRKCLIRKKPLKNNGPQGADVDYGEGDIHKTS